MIRTFYVLGLAGIREALRNRVTVVVAAFALVMIALTTVVMNMTIYSLDRVVTDFGLGVMSLLLVGLSVFMSVGMLHREIERRTIFLVVSRPISRSLFVVSRYIGMVATLTMLLLAMSAVYATQLSVFAVPYTSSIPAAIAGLWAELVLVCAMGVFFSSVSGPIPSAISVIGLYLTGQWTSDLHTLAVHLPEPLASIARAGYYVLPNFARMDFKASAAAGATAELSDVLGAIGASVGWSALFLAAATAAFSKRDFR